ncbi:MAG: Trk family potassium uptake protein [Kyrpidia tusciae]|nr:TrkH family potassium uptake protein [Kyrpidia tusciae]MBE3552478.1 Trk family potassium uptake protein [Kyrpidia tusciae]
MSSRPSIWTPARVLVLGFAAVIFVGGVLLSLPISSQSGRGLDFLDALFTATSAVCVTGLVVVDTGTYFSHFGQVVILLLIQIGGLGFMTVATFLLIMSRHRIGLKERLVIQESLNVGTLSGLVKFSRNVVLMTLTVEGIGALILALRWSFDMPWWRALYFGLFHGVSAFCNAGFDLFGDFRSLSGYAEDPVVNLTIMALITLGGLGFTVIVDLMKRRRSRRLSLHTKLVVITSLGLLLVGAAAFLALEWDRPQTFGPLDWRGKILSALFLSVTSRTAGYTTVDISQLSTPSLFLDIVLMFIGASPGSTGGGIKTVTFAAIVLFTWSVITDKENVVLYGRTISTKTIYKSLSIAIMSIMLIATWTFILTLMEPVNFIRLLYETTSAFGTVGLSTNLTPELSPPGRFMILLMMYIGRVGPLTLGLALAQRGRKKAILRYPEENLFVG